MKLTGFILAVFGVIVVYLSVRGQLEGTTQTLWTFLSAKVK